MEVSFCFPTCTTRTDRIIAFGISPVDPEVSQVGVREDNLTVTCQMIGDVLRYCVLLLPARLPFLTTPGAVRDARPGSHND